MRAITAAAAALIWMAAPARADVMSSWQRVAENTVRLERLGAPDAERALSMVEAAVDDAVNAAAPMGGASADIAAAVAAHDVLVDLFPSHKAALDKRLDAVPLEGLDEGAVEHAARAGHSSAKSVLASSWTWRRPNVPVERQKRLPKIPSLSVPLHSSSSQGEPMPAPPVRRSL